MKMKKQEIVIKKTLIEIETEEQEILSKAYEILTDILKELKDNQSFFDGECCSVFSQDIADAREVVRSISITDEIEITK